MPNGNAGGAANELGSLHRSGAAAFFAAHGMLGKAIEGRPGAIPVRIYLEASESVDDIVVQMQDGSSWYLQCKRSVGVNGPLRSTLAQWCRQDYAPGDRLGLVAREFRSDLRIIQNVIDQLNDEHGAPLNTGQLKALATLKRELDAAGSADADEMVHDALFLQCATESPVDAQQQIACALLGQVVKTGQGDLAFHALRNRMQDSAANRRWTDLADWLATLNAAGVEVTAEIGGAPVAAAEAKRQAVHAYREVVSRRRDLLSLSALNPGIGDVHVNDLLKDWQVRWESRSSPANLIHVARRNTRFLLTGLPGLGKSEALRQLAAHLASDAEAPVPILLDLKESLTAVHSGESITLDSLLRQAANIVTGIDPVVTTPALRDVVFSGNAVVIVDGLDEARSKRGPVAAQLAAILQDLPPATGFILSTRPSAMDAALQLGLPAVALESPKSLERTFPAIIRALTPPSIADSEAWIAERSRRVRAASQGTNEIWKVPLLATFATFRIANDEIETTNSVELLSNVIDDSISAWEHLKARHADGLDPEMRSSMLTDGFETIGCLINTTAVTVAAAEAAVEQQLEPWNLAGPLREQLARQIVHFWDERVGVFVKNGEELMARSRQFAELADARRAGRLSDLEKMTWITTALEDADLRQTVQLAVQNDHVLRQYLLEAAARGAPKELRSRAVQWVTEFVRNWPGVTTETEERIIDLIANAAEDNLTPATPGTSFSERITSYARDSGGWHFAIQLARFTPRITLRSYHRDRLLGLSVTVQQRELLELYIALTEATEQERALEQDEIARVINLLDTPKSAKSPATYEKGMMVISPGERYMEGIADVITLAVEHVDQLPEGSSDKFVEIAKGLNHGTFERVTTALSQRGYKVDLSHLVSAFESLDSVTELFSDKHGLGWLLRILADWPTDDNPGVPPEPWRWGEISELVSVIRWGESSAGSMRQLLDTPQELQRIWVDAVVEAYGLDSERLSVEARAILLEDDDETLWQICTPSLTSREPVRALDCEEATRLARCFASNSEDIVTLAARLTINTRCAEVSEVIESIDVPMTWQGRFLATTVSIATSAERDELIERYRRSESSQRAAVALIVDSLSDEYPETLAQLREDQDAAVRFHCRGDVRLANAWTCRYCFTENPVTQDSCKKCHLSCSWFS